MSHTTQVTLTAEFGRAEDIMDVSRYPSRIDDGVYPAHRDGHTLGHDPGLSDDGADQHAQSGERDAEDRGGVANHSDDWIYGLTRPARLNRDR